MSQHGECPLCPAQMLLYTFNNTEFLQKFPVKSHLRAGTIHPSKVVSALSQCPRSLQLPPCPPSPWHFATSISMKWLLFLLILWVFFCGWPGKSSTGCFPSSSTADAKVCTGASLPSWLMDHQDMTWLSLLGTGAG